VLKRLFPLGILFLFSACGYRLGVESSLGRYRTLSIPYVEGDMDGSLTGELIRRFSAASPFTYAYQGGDLTLKAQVVDILERNIGYRYERNKEGKLTTTTMPVEGRKSLVVEISVIETASGALLMRPVRLDASSEFDHDYYFTQNGVNIFSLGQLNDVDEARVAVMTPLQRAMAEKIVSYVSCFF